MKITKDNVKLGQNLYRSTDGAECPIVEIDEDDADMPVKVKTPEGFDWVESDGKTATWDADFTFSDGALPLETIITRLEDHDWGEDSEAKLREVWAIVGGGE